MGETLLGPQQNFWVSGHWEKLKARLTTTAGARSNVVDSCSISRSAALSGQLAIGHICMFKYTEGHNQLPGNHRRTVVFANWFLNGLNKSCINMLISNLLEVLEGRFSCRGKDPG